MTRTILRSDEFSCPSCVTKIEKALVATPGGADLALMVQLHSDRPDRG